MKRSPTLTVLAALLSLAAITAASAQNLPASMAYSSSALVRGTSTDAGQKLLIAGNSLGLESHAGFDLSIIPSTPGSAVRNSRIPSTAKSAPAPAVPTGERAALADSTTSTGHSKLGRSVALLGVLTIAYLASRKRSNPRMHGDISELRNFPKKRLAHREARA
ncbi:MAG: hypothetical protein EHM17_13085 [Verrucomicrobiaceae bacterium]|jgi:hypothetical protein|nr:MAG: hypothetical protein EHM17_13085 [Verrucomicrobiaceae bacterium]